MDLAANLHMELTIVELILVDDRLTIDLGLCADADAGGDLLFSTNDYDLVITVFQLVEVVQAGILAVADRLIKIDVVLLADGDRRTACIGIHKSDLELHDILIRLLNDDTQMWCLKGVQQGAHLGHRAEGSVVVLGESGDSEADSEDKGCKDSTCCHFLTVCCFSE